MPTTPFTPQNTLVILLGASAWPHRPTLTDKRTEEKYANNNPFQHSFEGMRSYFLENLKIPSENLINLFDTKENADSLLQQIEEFLETHQSATKDVFIYYVGHGTVPENELSLAIRASKKEYYDLPVKKLWRELGQILPQARCYFLLDACFSGKIIELPAKSDVRPESALFFCSSPPGELSFVKTNAEGQHVTVFTEALLKTLQGENPQLKYSPVKWSFRDIGSAVKQFIKTHYPDPSIAEPQFSSTGDQGAIENLQIFPNVWLTRWVNTVQFKLSKQRKELSLIYNSVAAYLKELMARGIQDRDNEKTDQLEAWAKDQLQNQELISFWQRHQTTQPPSYSVWSERLQKGRVVIFLGTHVPRIDITSNLFSKLTDTLECDSFKGSLSELCEYTEMEKGRNRLGQDTANCINSVSQSTQVEEVIFYQLLAQVKEPLVLISSEYTYLLDQAFTTQGKKFVVLAPLYDWENSETAGKLRLRYSDLNTSSELVQGQDLDCLSLLAQGYSLIYKLRGCVKADQQHLLLSENHYFKFACHIQDAIPNSLINLINELGLWFIGHQPNTWEDRLLIQTLLQRCRRAEGEINRMAIDESATDRFIGKFWQHQNVDSHKVGVREFVRELKKQLPFNSNA